MTMLFVTSSHAGLRGLPDGNSKVLVDDAAPLDTEDLKKAHKEGKVILLMFGNPDHCLYCEKVWANINALFPQYKMDVGAILKRHRASTFWGAENEDVKLGERYGVMGKPWLFIIDKQGIVRNVIMGPVGRDVIEAEIRKLLQTGK